MTNFQCKILQFDQLSPSLLYDILQFRTAIFVVEQKCAYQELDGKDHDSVHILGLHDESLIAYSRIYLAGNSVHIGRVAVASAFRHQGIGRQMMQTSITYGHNHWPKKNITLSAQFYTLHFYQSLGFSPLGSPYLWDGILHLDMISYY